MNKTESDSGEPTLSSARRREVEISFSRQGFLNGLGARLVDLGAGRCVVELPFSDAVTQQQGFFHGGAMGALADTAGGYAAMTLLPDRTEVVTLEYKINFLRPAAGDAIIAVGEVLRAGRSVVVTRVDVHVRRGEQRVLCAALQQSIAPAPQAVRP